MSAWRERVEIAGGRAVLYLGDNRDIWPTLPRPDAIVTDPPYGVPVMLSSDLGARGPARIENGRDWGALVGNDAAFDPSPWVTAADLVLLWGANHFAHMLPHNGKWLVWDKRCGIVPQRSQADCEIAWVSDYSAARVLRFLWDGVCQDEKKGARYHPTEKPEGVMSWCLDQAKVAPGALVADPYMGSGTTGLACMRRGCRFVGIEIDEGYFGTACRRIEQAARQPDLLIPETVA